MKVWWLVGDGGEYYEGTVTAQRKAHRGSEDLFIEYDDGTRRWHNTQTSQIVELATEDTPEQVSQFPSPHPIDCVLTRCFVCSSSLRLQVRGRERPRMPPGLGARPAQGVAPWSSRRGGA